MPLHRRRIVSALVLAGLVAVAAPVGAQAPRQAQSATVAVSLRVLPQASFDASDQGVSAAVVPGEALRIAPGAGVRTRMVYTAATQVVVRGTPLVGPGGATLRVRFVCAFGGGMTVSAAEPFDCVDGVVAGLDGTRLSSMSLAIGAELSARETAALPPGLYSGRVTLIATHPVY